MSALVLAVTFKEPILARWKISNGVALWVMLLVGLLTLWLPIFSGILQGQQNFLWLGWSSILNSTGRLVAVAVIVFLFHGYAAGMTIGIFSGILVSVAIGVIFSREVWLGASAEVNWKEWLGRVVPLTIGYGSFQFMYSADPLYVQAFFDKEQTGFYMAAGTLGRALVTFTGPVVAVMFPKIVRSAALAEQTNVLRLTLIITAVLTGLGALGMSLVAPWLLTLVYKDTYRAAVPLLPWFAAGMVPLALANVLLNNLMARQSHKVLPWLLIVAGSYAGALAFRHGTFLQVIQTMGFFNLIFLGVVSIFTWIDVRHEAVSPLQGKRDYQEVQN